MEELKKVLYFPIASYFRFFAKIRLHRWHPKIVVITGSSGKTTILHLLESQIGAKAKYSHHANSSFGIPFDVLDLHRKSLRSLEWVNLFFKAPFLAFKKPPKEKLYIVEADCDRPNEGKFLAEFLKPDHVLWFNISRTHSTNFDALISKKRFATVDEAIAYEYGYFLEYCTISCIVNGDSDLITQQLLRTKAQVEKINKKASLQEYHVTPKGTEFIIDKKRYSFPFLLPEDVVYALVSCAIVKNRMGEEIDTSFHNFSLPPGRGSLFQGIKNTLLIDSSYNANLGSIKAMLSMFAKISEKKKWVVIGDMLELGKKEKEEHEDLAELLAKMEVEKIILFGPRTAKYTAQKLRELQVPSQKIESFQSLKELDTYLQVHLKGGEAILFKGSQSMLLEGVIEGLLKSEKDAQLLPRREQIWKERRHKLLS